MRDDEEILVTLLTKEEQEKRLKDRLFSLDRKVTAERRRHVREMQELRKEIEITREALRRIHD